MRNKMRIVVASIVLLIAAAVSTAASGSRWKVKS
jgi:hypothetical protein